MFFAVIEYEGIVGDCQRRLLRVSEKDLFQSYLPRRGCYFPGKFKQRVTVGVIEPLQVQVVI